MNKDLKQINNFKGREKIQQYSNEFPLPRERCGKTAFTLAEVLITLGIIGVVAAMTLPVLIQKHQKKVTVTKLKKAYTTLSQVIQKSYADNGSTLDYLPIGEEITADVTENFFNTYYLPYFKSPSVLQGVYNFENGCSPSYQYSMLSGECLSTSIFTTYSMGRCFFSANDGITFFIIVKTEGEGGQAIYSTQNNIYVDINGLAKPNQLGKDVFRFTIDWANNIIRPNGYNKTIEQINQNCRKTGEGSYCAAKIINDGWEIKDDYPW